MRIDITLVGELLAAI